MKRAFFFFLIDVGKEGLILFLSYFFPSWTVTRKTDVVQTHFFREEAFYAQVYSEIFLLKLAKCVMK